MDKTNNDTLRRRSRLHGVFVLQDMRNEEARTCSSTGACPLSVVVAEAIAVCSSLPLQPHFVTVTLLWDVLFL